MPNLPLGDMPLPGPPWLMLTVLLVIFWLHVMSIWLLMGGLVVGGSKLVGDKLDWQNNRAVRFLPVIMAIAINLGVPPLLMLQVLYPPFFFSASVIIAVPWLAVFFLVLIAYGFIYLTRYGAKRHWQAVAYFLVSTVSVLTVSFIFSNNMTLMLKPDEWLELYSYKQSGLNLAPDLPQVVARWAWVISPALVAGLALFARGSRGWLLASAGISLVGLYAYRALLPAQILDHEVVAFSTIFDYLLALAMLIYALLPRSGKEMSAMFLFAWVAFKGIAVVTLRHGIRMASLDPVYPLSNLPLDIDPGLIAMFVVALIVGLSAVTWMYVNGRKEVTI